MCVGVGGGGGIVASAVIVQINLMQMVGNIAQCCINGGLTDKNEGIPILATFFTATLSTKAWFAWLKPACGHMKNFGLSPFNIQASSVVAAKRLHWLTCIKNRYADYFAKKSGFLFRV